MTMRNRPLLYLVLLVAITMGFAQRTPRERITFGFAHFETVEVSDAGSHMKGPVIIGVTGEKSNVRSFAQSNEAGIAYMPLPKGRYCYDAYASNGEPLSLVRMPGDRCFDLHEHETVTVGVEFRRDDER